MAAKTLMTCEDYAALQEPEGMRYELSEGELVVTPSASFLHNDVRDNLSARLRTFVESHKLGEVTSETDRADFSCLRSAARGVMRLCTLS